MPMENAKPGNAIWVQCAACRGWFHVSEDLLAATQAKLHCPHCHEEFYAGEAGRVENPR